MSQPLTTPQDDAERIRLKRLAKLQGTTSSSSSPTPSTSSPPTPKPKPAETPPAQKPKPVQTVPVKTSIVHPAPAPSSTPPAKKRIPVQLDFDSWAHDTISAIFKVTLDKSVAADSGYDLVWLKGLESELREEESITGPVHLKPDMIDRLLISRLEVNPGAMSDDLDYLPVLASLPPQQTVFELLVACWKRVNATRSSVLKKGYSPVDAQSALDLVEKIRELVISYAGLTLQEPEMFPQPEGRRLGPPELVEPLLSLSALSAPLLGTTTNSPNTLTPSDINQFLSDLARRFEPDNEIDGVLGPVVRQLLFHPSLFRPEGLAGGDAGWRGVIGGLEALVSIKSIAVMLTRMEEWIPSNATPANFEIVSLLGPLCRLGVFPTEWPAIAKTYFSDSEKRSKADIESSFASLRGTVKSLQAALFQIFNTLVRASPESREAVLQYFARVISLNVKRAGMQVDPATVSSDSFMLNLQAVLLRFAENFIDPGYTKLDRIDPLFYARCPRIDLSEETRIKATSEEAATWVKEHADPTAPPPNFISNIFYITVAMSHYGYLRTVQTYNDFAKHIEDMQRHMEMLNGDGSWMGTPIQARVESAINGVKVEISKIKSAQLAYETQLLDPELVFQCLGFTNFLVVWLIRQADPKKLRPNPPVELPLPDEVPMSFRVLPEYIVEDIVDYLYFAVQTSPDKFELSGKNELLIFTLTFLSSTWYIKNPFLKSKINDVLFMSIWGYGYERHGILGNLLNTHPIALKHLMPTLMHFYVEVEQTGASSQFYDKFNARRNISYILKVVWNNPTHREALSITARNVEKFVRFANLMINDVTYLLDESLTDLVQIKSIQDEMRDQIAWNARPQDYRREREGTLRSLERQASGYISLARSTVELLKVFTAETKAPFMMPEIVERLAAMLDYNLVSLAGPKQKELVVKNAEKYRFDPKALLSDILQVYLNLSDQEEFIRAVAIDGRSYSKEIFTAAENIAIKHTLKSEGDIQLLRQFVARVEEAKATMEAEEDLGPVPDELLDPIMATLMRDPVILPSSKAIVDRSTIKSHLLSDTTDPFNRKPLKIEEVIPHTELKAQIDDFVAERRQKMLAATKDTDVAMSE